MTLEPGARFGAYDIVARVGAGGMGVVYKAIDRRLGRPVAIKTVADSQADRALPAEARAAASLDHPFVCKVYEVVETADASVIVMEFVEGETLAAVLKRGPLTVLQAARVALEIAEGLADAHAHGLVHRDIKPANVMLTPYGHVKLLDFGLARRDAIASPDDATRTASAAPAPRTGTPSYMAPEQILGGPVTFRADLFSLGVLIFECVTQTLPFDGRTVEAYLEAVVSEVPRALTPLAPGAPGALVDLVDQCLAKRPEDRPESASGIAAVLRTVVDASSRGAHVAGTGLRRRRTWPLVVGAAALVLAGAIVWSRRPEPADVVAPFSLPLITMWPSEEGGSRLSPDGRWVSWLSRPKGHAELFVRAAEGGDARPLTLPDGEVVTHTWSPDGRSIACILLTGGHLVLDVVPAVLGGPVSRSVALPMPATPYVRALRWAGTAVFLEVNQAGQTLYRADLDRGTVDDVSAAWRVAGTVTGIDVTPDGRRAVFLLDHEDAENLWIVDIPGAAVRPLTNDRFFKSTPIWAGSSGTVVYESNRSGQRDLWALDAASGRFTQLASGGTQNIAESSSADGAFVTFQRVTETANLFIAPATGGASQQTTSDALNDASPTRSSNGLTIAFERSHPLADDSTALLDASLMVKRTTDGGSDADPEPVATGFYPRVSPDGTHLAYLDRRTSPAGASVLHVLDLRSRVDAVVSTWSVMPFFTLAPAEWVSQNVAWTAESNAVYYVDRAGAGRPFALRAFDVATSADRTVAEAPAGEMILDVFPSRDRVAYLSVSRPFQSPPRLIVAERGRLAPRVVARFDEPMVSLLGWVTNGQAMVAERSVGGQAPDGSRAVEILEVSADGTLRSIARLAHAFPSTMRFEPARGEVYVTVSDLTVRNLYCVSVRDGSVRFVTDNRMPTVTFSSPAPLADGSVMFVRNERREEIWLVRLSAQSHEPDSGKSP